MNFHEALKRAVELVPKGGYVGIQTEQNLSDLVESSVKADLVAGGHMAFQGRLFWLMRSYRVVEAVGRWSMIDIFVISILVALVRLGNIATIEPGAGATAFAGVVVITMFAASSFDPRLIWDVIGSAERGQTLEKQK